METIGSRKWGNSELSTIGEREYFYKRLEKHLDEAGFLYPEEWPQRFAEIYAQCLIKLP